MGRGLVLGRRARSPRRATDLVARVFLARCLCRVADTPKTAVAFQTLGPRSEGRTERKLNRQSVDRVDQRSLYLKQSLVS